MRRGRRDAAKSGGGKMTRGAMRRGVMRGGVMRGGKSSRRTWRKSELRRRERIGRVGKGSLLRCCYRAWQMGSRLKAETKWQMRNQKRYWKGTLSWRPKDLLLLLTGVQYYFPVML